MKQHTVAPGTPPAELRNHRVHKIQPNIVQLSKINQGRSKTVVKISVEQKKDKVHKFQIGNRTKLKELSNFLLCLLLP